MPAKGWRKPFKPIEGSLRDEVEQWLDNGGYLELKKMLIPEFGSADDERAAVMIHEVVASAMNPVTWKGFDRTKRKRDAIGFQMRMVLWRYLINYRRDNYDKELPYSLTDSEGEQRDVATYGHTQVGAHIDLKRAVESLEQPYRDIFTMIAGGGWTVEEVAYTKFMDVYDVEDKYDTARLRLWKQLKAYGYNVEPQECGKRSVG